MARAAASTAALSAAPGLPEPGLAAPRVAADPLRRVRAGNDTAALRALHEFHRLSRAGLARELRLNRSSAGHIVSGLLADGLVREVEGSEESGASLGARRAGRPGILLELVPEAVVFVGVEIGVEHISAVEVDLAGGVVRSAEEPFDGPGTPPGKAVRRALDLAFGPMPPERLRACEGLGLATPSQMGPDGVVRVAPLLGWANLDLLALLREAAPAALPLMVENDANALAVGATYGRGAARGGVTLVLNLETGVGGGILIDGRLFRGAQGLAGEVGHLRVGADGPGASVTIEERLGLEGVLAELRAGAPGDGPDDKPRLAGFLRDVRDREPGAVGVAERWARSLAFAIAQAARVIDPDRVILGGSLAALYPLVAARVLAHLHTLQEPTFPVPTILVEEAGAAFGAACMMHQRLLLSDVGSDRRGRGLKGSTR